MRRIMVRYTVTPQYAATNEQRVREVYEELGHLQPEGFRYGTFKLDDGVSFVHLATQEGEDSPLSQVTAFQRFQESLRGNCDQPPLLTELEEVGSYRLSGGPA
jgi:hypothetical protein